MLRLCCTKQTLPAQTAEPSRGPSNWDNWNTTAANALHAGIFFFLLSLSFLNSFLPRACLHSHGGGWALPNYFLNKRGSVSWHSQWGITPQRHTYIFSPFLSLFQPLCNLPHYLGSGAKKIWTKSPEQLVSVRGPCQNTNTNLLLLFSLCVCMAGKDSRQVFQYGSFWAQMNTSYKPFKLHNPTSEQQLSLSISTKESFACVFFIL